MREGLLVEGVALVVAGDRGSQLAFRYPIHPYNPQEPVIPVRITDKASANQINVPLFGIRPSEFANLFCPKAALFGHVLSFLVGNHHFLSYPLQLAATKSQETTFFNVVLTLSKSAQNSKIFEPVIERLANILLHEQKRCGFITQEVQKILSMQDQFMAAATNKATWTLSQQHAALKDLTDKIGAKSLLANHLKKLVDQLQEKDGCRLLINDWCSLCVKLCDPDELSTHHIRPYQTLLLTQRTMTILDSLPKDCSPQLRCLVQKANPCLSFVELEKLLELSLSQLYRLSVHLVYWGKARIVNKVSENYIYVVPPTLDEVSLSSANAIEFGTRFPTQSLPEVLSRFCVHKKLSEHLKRLSMKAKEMELHMLLWLLQRRYVEQLHTFLYLSPAIADELVIHPPRSLPASLASSPAGSPSLKPHSPTTPLPALVSPRKASHLLSADALPSETTSSPRSRFATNVSLVPAASLGSSSCSSCSSSSSRSPSSSSSTSSFSFSSISSTSSASSTSLADTNIVAESNFPTEPVAAVITALPTDEVKTEEKNEVKTNEAKTEAKSPESDAPVTETDTATVASTPNQTPATTASTSSATAASTTSASSSTSSAVTISVFPASPLVSSSSLSSQTAPAASPTLHRTTSPMLNPTEALFLRLKPYFNGEYDMVEICWREDVSLSVLEALCAAKSEEIIQVTTFVPADEHGDK